MKSRTESEAQRQVRLDREASRSFRFRSTTPSLSRYKAEANEDRKLGFVSNASFFSPPVIVQSTPATSQAPVATGLPGQSLAEQFSQLLRQSGK